VRRSRRKGKIFVISGPSGSGKTTLLESLLKHRELKGKLYRSISLTTRSRRHGERDGLHYFFVRREEFQKLLKAKKILEWTKYLGYYYATPRDFVDKQLGTGRNLALCLDAIGARKISKLYPRQSVTIFIAPPSIEELRKRITDRAPTKRSELHKRLAIAKKEVLGAAKYDYCLMNDDFKQAVNGLKDIVLREIFS
jgi:guanylate kinase